jgi:hypothetical protein
MKPFVSLVAILLTFSVLVSCGSNDDPQRVIIVHPEQEARQEALRRANAAAADFGECFEKISTDTRVQSDDCFHMTKDDETSWEDRIHEFGDCVESGKARKDCY